MVRAWVPLRRIQRDFVRHASANSDAVAYTNAVEIDLTAPARTRFAPSPTGRLHLGSLRTALFNYLLAKRTNGQFIVRIEDTDVTRTIPGADKSILEDLRWAKLDWDEGPKVGGPYGPYRQSQRVLLGAKDGVARGDNIYKRTVEKLIDKGYAYRCFCAPEELAARAKHMAANGLSTNYNGKCSHLTKGQSKTMAQTMPFAVRFKDIKDLPWDDLVFGRQNQPKGKKTRKREDFILLKRDGWPTYHLANVVDDHAMKITHVIRGVEWLQSTPKHLALYHALGWMPPRFGHAGLLRDENESKLSKRDLAFDIEYFKKTVDPDALLNFLALLGWKGDSQKSNRTEVLTMEEMVSSFDMRLNKTNPIVALGKLQWLQQMHSIRKYYADPKFADQTLKRIVAAVTSDYSNDQLESVGLHKPGKLKTRIKDLLSDDYFRKPDDWHLRHSYAFCTHSSISQAPLTKLKSQQTIQALTEAYDMDEEYMRKAILKSFVEAFDTAKRSWTLETIKVWHREVIDELHTEYELRQRPQQREEGTFVTPEVHGQKGLTFDAVSSYLRQWVARGHEGAGIVAVMYALGFDVVKQRIETGRLLLPPVEEHVASEGAVEEAAPPSAVDASATQSPRAAAMESLDALASAKS